MVTVRNGLAVGWGVLVVLLVGVSATAGLGVAGWVGALVCGTVIHSAVARGAPDALGPADLVTLTRAAFGCAVGGLVADSFLGQAAVPSLVALTVVALALDAVDGHVARRTRTVSPFGARFDGEVDAFLILLLSVFVARSLGVWVLTIGLARYAFGLAGHGLPWMRRQLPPRYWRKVVAATQGIVLTVAAAAVAPSMLTYAALAAALGLLAESFGRDVMWLWRHQRDDDAWPAVAQLLPRVQRR